MKAERIGATPRDELKWVLRMLYPARPLTEGDKLNLMEQDLMLFAFGADIPVPVRTVDYLHKTLVLLKAMVEKAVTRLPITEIPRPYAPQLSWDKSAHRYKMDARKDSEFFETRVAGRLGELILSHGHLLKICTAPEAMKRGRKPKDHKDEPPRGICGKRFLAVKETQLYCSPQCGDRALKNKPKPKVKKKKKR